MPSNPDRSHLECTPAQANPNRASDPGCPPTHTSPFGKIAPILPLQNGATFAKPDSVAAVVVMLGSGDAYFILGTETVPRCMSTAARTCDVPVTGPAGQRTPTCQVPRGDRTPSLRRSGYRRRGRSFRSPPPTRSVASKMITRRPSRAAVYAAVSARPPEPTIRRSHSVSQGTARPDYRDLMPAQSFR